MQKVDDIIYISASSHLSASFTQALDELREKVCANLKEGWVLNGSFAVYTMACTITIIQPMIKYEQTQQLDTTSQLLPIRRKADSS